jgi:short-subunit dehydrogenase
MGNVVITGATGGIGFEFCRHYLQQGHRVIAVCRKPTDELKALGPEIVDGVDLTTEDGIAKVKKACDGTKIDLLINNAGMMQNEILGDIDPESLRVQFELNAMAPLRLTEILLPQLQDGSKVAMITSRMGSIADNTSGGRYGYRASKAALNMLSVSLAHDIRDRNIWVGILHPGFVQTKMTNFNGQLTPEQSVQGMTKIIDQAKVQESGQFWHSNGETLPW